MSISLYSRLRAFPRSAGMSIASALVLRLAAQGSVFIAIILLGRLLGPEDFGRYAFLFGVMTFLSLFNVAGINDVLVREMAASPQDREVTYRNGMGLKLVCGMGSVVLALALLSFFPLVDLPWWAGALGALTLLFSFSTGSYRTIWEAPYQVDFRMGVFALVNFTAKALFLIFLVLWTLVKLRITPVEFLHLAEGALVGGAAAAVVLQIAAEALGTGLQGAFNVKYGYSLKPCWNPAIIRRLLKEVWPLALSGGLMMALAKVNLAFIRLMLPARDMGLYAAPMRLVEALYILPTVFVAGVLPVLSTDWINSREKFKRSSQIGLKILMTAALPVAVVVNLYSSEVMGLFGPGYSDSAPVMAAFVWLTPLGFSAIFLHAALVAAGGVRTLTAVYFIQAVAALGLNLLFIRWWGAPGAAWAQVAAYGVMFPAMLAFPVSRHLGKVWFKITLPAAAAALVCALIVHRLNVGLGAAVIITPTLFLIAAYLMGWIRKRDWEEGMKLLREK
ncbi:MAG: flippase [Calditrichota bacterium]